MNIRTMIKKAIYYIKLTLNPVVVELDDGTIIKGIDMHDVNKKHAAYLVETHSEVVSVTFQNGETVTR